MDKGSTSGTRNLVKYNPKTNKQSLNSKGATGIFSLQFKMNLSQNVYQIRVIQLKTFFESLAEIMGFLAGFSFIARFSKHVLS